MHCRHINIYIDKFVNAKQLCRKLRVNSIYNDKNVASSLTHLGRVMHTGVRKLTIIGSENGWLPVRRQAII